MRRMTGTWQRLRESTEGPTVTISIPREWAEELMRSLMTSLEIEDNGGEPDEDGEEHAEPDEDDLGGEEDGDSDDDLMGMFGDPQDDEDVPAGDDSDDDEADEAAGALDFSRGRDDGDRPETALGEGRIGFKKLKGELSHQKGVKDPGGLAAAIGRKKYGAAGMAKKSAAGRKHR